MSNPANALPVAARMNSRYAAKPRAGAASAISGSPARSCALVANARPPHTGAARPIRTPLGRVSGIRNAGAAASSQRSRATATSHGDGEEEEQALGIGEMEEERAWEREQEQDRVGRGAGCRCSTSWWSSRTTAATESALAMRSAAASGPIPGSAAVRRISHGKSGKKVIEPLPGVVPLGGQEQVVLRVPGGEASRLGRRLLLRPVEVAVVGVLVEEARAAEIATPGTSASTKILKRTSASAARTSTLPRFCSTVVMPALKRRDCSRGVERSGRVEFLLLEGRHPMPRPAAYASRRRDRGAPPCSLLWTAALAVRLRRAQRHRRGRQPPPPRPTLARRRQPRRRPPDRPRALSAGRHDARLHRRRAVLADRGRGLRAAPGQLRHDRRRLLLLVELVLRARARRHPSRRADPLRRARLDRRPGSARAVGHAGGGDRRHRQDRDRPRLPIDGGRRHRVGGRARPDPRRRGRLPAHRLGEPLARSQELSRRRHAQRRHATCTSPPSAKTPARLLVEQRKVAALGIDTASIDYGPSKDFIVHRVATAANVVGFENVAGLGELPATGAWTIALPMKIAKGTGGPLRVVGVVPR